MIQQFSDFLKLNARDAIKGLIVAVIGGVVGLISATIEAGSLSFDWPLIGKTALLVGLSYIIKNWLTNSEDKFAKAEPK
jgi:hypothetical protein